MAVTIKDVASKAGVSTSMVSKVLNNPEYGKNSTRKKILMAASTLNYRPHAIARSLAKRESKTLGLVLPDLENPVFPTIAQAVERASRRHGYNLLLCNSNKSEKVEASYVNMLMNNSVDGMIFFSILNSEDVTGLRDSGVRVLVIERPSTVPDVDMILLDNRDGGYQAAKHLVELGHRRIGILVGPLAGEIEAQRYEGYKQALTEVGVKMDDRYVKVIDYDEEEALKATNELLRLKNPPTAIFAACDIMALGVLRAAESKGIKVPGELSIIGYDNTLSKYTTPMLSTVAPPLSEMGAEAVRVMVEHLKNPGQRLYQRVVFKPTLIARDSTGPAS